jgi:ketosteroid isomerase-like protein
MTDANVGVVREGYRTLAEGDVEGFMALLDPEVEWTHPDELPYGGTHRGIAGMQEVVRLWGETYELMQVIPEEFLDAGDDVIVIGRYVVRPRNGERLETWFVNVFRVRDGKISRFRDFSDKAARLAARTGEAARA